MELLKKGDHPNTWYGKCSYCGAVYSAETKELNVVRGDFRSDGVDYAWATCPECRKSTAICFHREDSKDAHALRMKERI